MGKSFKENTWKKNFGKKQNSQKNQKPVHRHQRENEQRGIEDFDQSWENNQTDDFGDTVSLMS